MWIPYIVLNFFYVLSHEKFIILQSDKCKSFQSDGLYLQYLSILQAQFDLDYVSCYESSFEYVCANSKFEYFPQLIYLDNDELPSSLRTKVKNQFSLQRLISHKEVSKFDKVQFANFDYTTFEDEVCFQVFRITVLWIICKLVIRYLIVLQK